jgi:SNF2 family DNA or RNA helicase
VFQLVAKGTVEERVLAIQDKKDALISQVRPPPSLYCSLAPH